MRNRMIKPEFWQDEKIGQLPVLCRLLYIGLWNLSDDYGVVKGNSVWIKGQLFPYDGAEVDSKKISDALDQLEASGRIKGFTKNNEWYYDIPKFREHQVINRPSKQRNPTLTEAEAKPAKTEDLSKFPLITAWNAFAETYDLPGVSKATDSRKRAMKKSGMDVKGFTGVLERVLKSSFLMGKSPRSEAHASWKIGFDWIIKEDNYTKVLEGKYDDGPKQGEKSSGYSIP